MPFSAAEVLLNAGVLLQDAKATRWPYSERLEWMNAAARVIAVQKPTATAATIQVNLSQGVLQQLPATYHMMLDAIRNLATLDGSPAGRSGGIAIQPMSRDEIDTLIPGWSNPSVLPYAREVYYLMDDTNDPSRFLVVPGNNGEGVIEVVASRVPPALVLADGADPDLIASYTGLICPLQDEYRQPVLDFVLSKCYLKEVNVPGLAAKAQAHYALFQEALGIKTQGEAAQNVNTPRQRPAM